MNESEKTQLDRTNQALGLEVERLRAAVVELNERLDDRTQGFLRVIRREREVTGRKALEAWRKERKERGDRAAAVVLMAVIALALLIAVLCRP